MTLTRAITTLGPIGYLRPAPGTWGSLAALPLAWIAYSAFGLAGFLALLLIASVGGVWCIKITTKDSDNVDLSEIVIDELVGQWIALLPVLVGSASRGVDVLALWPGWLVAFVVFRCFDIWKPWLIGRADARNDALGVMLDDILAGIAAALTVLLCAGVAHGLMAL